MKRLVLVLLTFAGCSTNTWAIPQPYFKVTQPDTLWQRAIATVTEHCNGVSGANDEAQVIIGQWEQWNTPEGLVLTQCLVTILHGDEHVRDVRVTFAARRCPLSDMSDLDALLKSCEVSDSVPDQVRTTLMTKGEQIEKDLTTVAR